MEKNRKTSIDALEQQLTSFSMMSPAEAFERFGLNNDGLNAEQIEKGREKYGENVISTGNENSIFTRIRESLINPFNPNLLICKLRFFIGLSPFCRASLLIVI